MNCVPLGKTGLKVTPLCLGILPMSRAQYGLPLNDGRALVEAALASGINFFDTAELYDAYAYLSGLGRRADVIISSRSYAFDRTGMQRSVENARRSLDRDVIDVFGLHEQESEHTLKGHWEALRCLVDYKTRGVIRAISVSTHYVQCVSAAISIPEIDVIFAVLNSEGMGIRGGRREDMEEALCRARSAGKGIYIMKALGGGHLHRHARRALIYARDFSCKDSVAVGVKNTMELDFAVSVFEGRDTPEALTPGEGQMKRLAVEEWCQGCGECQRACGFGAIEMIGGRAVIDSGKCMMCGYCARVCPHFCIKVMG